MKTNRRNFLQTMGVGAAGLGMASLPIPASAVPPARADENRGQKLFIDDLTAIAQTRYGKVQGFILRDIYQFRGIPYGAASGGKNRFMPPRKPESWDETFPAVWWGDSAPQIMEGRYDNSYASFVDHWNYDTLSEDCLRLNVWTPGLDDGKKRPVLVWFHGGGYRNGNGIEQDGYNGENFSRFGDVVFVSINHRLGPIGFSDLSGVGGERYAASGNAGALDMLASLEWVRDNIAGFGGDPDNVTIMGQSGGGAKVCVLAAMPRAEGLFHKMVPLSGSTLHGQDPQVSQKVGEFILREAGLRHGEVDKLRDIPWKEYLQLAGRAAEKYTDEHGEQGMRGSFGPVSDGTILTEESFFSNPEGLSSGVPMLICSTFHEWNMSRNNQEMENMDFDRVRELLRDGVGFQEGLGERSAQVVEAYRDVFPGASPVEVLTLITSNRKSVVETANAKAVQSAPVYVAWFGWEPPLFNNRMRAFHCLDISFWFYNTDVMFTHTGGGERPRALSQKMASALLQFMKTGDPNGGALPHWAPYTEDKGETMVLDDDSTLMNDPDREARRLL